MWYVCVYVCGCIAFTHAGPCFVYVRGYIMPCRAMFFGGDGYNKPVHTYTHLHTHMYVYTNPKRTHLGKREQELLMDLVLAAEAPAVLVLVVGLLSVACG